MAATAIAEPGPADRAPSERAVVRPLADGQRSPRAARWRRRPRCLHWLRWLPSVLVLAPWLLSQGQITAEARIRALAAPVSFRLLDWETESLAGQAPLLLEGLFGAPAAPDAGALRAYFAAATPEARVPLRASAQAAIARAVRQGYVRAGLAGPVAPDDARLFPPVLIALTPPPNVLVISPRTTLQVVQSTLLNPLDTPAQVALERSAESNGVSSLVAPIGGIATYPAMVLEGGSAESVLASAAHEWLHHYLAFYPLGRGYFGSQETREINETTADLAGQEVARVVSADLGLAAPTAPASPLPPASATAPVPGAQPPLDFRAFMRATRLEVERLLAAGQVQRAEAYMEERRQQVNAHGYAIRKLNQAYFAFYGSYGEGFAASPRNPVPDLLRRLRDRSPSLGAFLARVREVTTVDQLRALVE